MRNKIDIQTSLKNAQPKQQPQKPDQPVVPEMDKIKRDNTPMLDYYKAWDKFAKVVEEDDDTEAKNPTFKGEFSSANPTSQ